MKLPAWLGRALRIGFAVFVVLPVALLLLGRLIPVQLTPLMALRLVENGDWPHQDWVPLDEIAPQLIWAVLAAEDGAFCEHGGFDWKQLAKAAKEKDDGRVRGASTLSMQTTKNLFLWPDSDPLRKAFEFSYTPLVETLWTKRRIMEVYLNIAEWGPGIYGAETAAQTYFQVPAKELSQRQAALLAAALPNPLERNPGEPSGWLRERAGTIAARAQDMGAYDDCLGID